MESFDESLKFLLHEEPGDFLRFGFADPTVEVIRPSEVDLPSRDRDIDGSYLIERQGSKLVGHIEFHRKHQKLRALALDIGDAQLRLFRREECRVVTHVWDLYGSRKTPLLTTRTLVIGPDTRVGYVRINLRAMSWWQLLEEAPPSLWPLVPLTKDGATEKAVKAARDAIVSKNPQNSSHLADHLAVLWFVAEAEDVPTKLMQLYIQEAQLMESTLYKSIFASGKARGEALGEARGEARGLIKAHTDTICILLTRHLGSLAPGVRERLASWPHPDKLEAWRNEAVALTDAKSARKLLQKIMKTPVPPSLPPAVDGSSQAA